MTTFNANDHPRGQAKNAGAFRDKANSAPEGGLASEPSTADLLDEIAGRLPNDKWAGDPDTLACIALSVLVEPGDDAVGASLRTFGPRAALERAAERGKIPSRGNVDAVVAAIAKARLFGIGLMTPGGNGWPAQFADLGNRAPYALWTKGDVKLLGGPENMTSITGSRAATGYGEHVTMEIASSLSEAGQTVVTGAAYGIDGMAIRATLSMHGNTVAVLAGGMDRYYPAGHQALLERVDHGGLLIAEMAPGAPPTKLRLASRRRIIAALSGRTIVVEAGIRSGALEVASEAWRLHRDVCAVPGPVTSAASVGTNEMIADGTARLVTNAQDVMKGPRV